MPCMSRKEDILENPKKVCFVCDLLAGAYETSVRYYWLHTLISHLLAFCCLFGVLRILSRTLNMLGTCSTVEPKVFPILLFLNFGKLPRLVLSF